MKLAWLALATLAGCADRGPYGDARTCEGTVTPVDESPTARSRVVAQVMPTRSANVDILFVIDDSKSMTDEQEQLGIWSSEMFDVIRSTDEPPNLHVGVVSSSVAIPDIEGCEQTGRLQWLASEDTDDLPAAFAAMARVGDAGCGFEQPFEAARIALDWTPGFLRDDALLLVVFVTDEDDCSAIDTSLYGDRDADSCSALGPRTSYRCFEHGVRCHDGLGSRELGERRDCRPDEESPYLESVSGFADHLKGLKRHPGQVIVAGIYGKPNRITVVRDERIPEFTTPRLASVCARGAEGIGATPAVRMNALMAEFGGRASQSSICDATLSWAMRDVGLVARDVAARSPCARGAIGDVDSCRVELSRVDQTTRSIAIPRCRSTMARRASRRRSTRSHAATPNRNARSASATPNRIRRSP
jgi:hypothetical protein